MKKAEKESIAIARHIHAFLSEYVPSQKSRSGNTLKSYEYAISLYIGFLAEEKGIDSERLSCGCFSRDMIEEWLRWLTDNRGCSPETCNVRLASLRAFLKYLGGKEVSMLHISEAASGIQRRKETRKKVKGMSKDAVRALMAAPDTSTTAGRRDLALIVTMYGTAARIDEILSMKVGQLHLDARNPNVNIIGKGNKIRTLYLLPKAVAHLKGYLKEFQGCNPDPDAYVFYSRNAGPCGKMSQMAVNKRLRLHAETAHKSCIEVPPDIHAHQLRHAKATHWLEDGMNIVQISLLLGHEQLQTTLVYLDVTIEQKAEALATLEDENNRKTPKKWRSNKASLANFCGVKPIKR
ncbi:MAG: tyrosine-type recombinase/integrase [Bacilli bacterium]